MGTWADVAALAADTEMVADLIVNHVSRHSPRFQDYDAHGHQSPYAGMFLTWARVFPQGVRESDLLALYTIRPSLPFTIHDATHGARLYWTTFTSDQDTDIDVMHPEGRRYLARGAGSLPATLGIRMIRLDAVGFAVKKAGTSCFSDPRDAGGSSTS